MERLLTEVFNIYGKNIAAPDALILTSCYKIFLLSEPFPMVASFSNKYETMSKAKHDLLKKMSHGEAPAGISYVIMKTYTYRRV